MTQCMFQPDSVSYQFYLQLIFPHRHVEVPHDFPRRRTIKPSDTLQLSWEPDYTGRVLAGDIVLCSWARHITLKVPLPTQVYKWVPANLMLGVTLR